MGKGPGRGSEGRHQGDPRGDGTVLYVACGRRESTRGMRFHRTTRTRTHMHTQVHVCKAGKSAQRQRPVPGFDVGHSYSDAATGGSWGLSAPVLQVPVILSL